MNVSRGRRLFARMAAASSLCLAVTIGLTIPVARASTGSNSAVKTIAINLPTSSTNAAAPQAGGSPCQGSNTVTWTGGGPASYFGHDVLSLGCIPTTGIAAFFIQCQSSMYYNGAQVDPGGAQSAGTDSCNYTTTTNFAFLIFSGLTVRANFQITIISQPGYAVVWGPGSNICTGVGTPTATCQDGPYQVTVPFTSVHTYA